MKNKIVNKLAQYGLMLAIRIALLKSILFVYRAYKISCSGKKVVDKSQSGWYSLEAVSEGNKKPEKTTEKNKKAVDKSQKDC